MKRSVQNISLIVAGILLITAGIYFLPIEIKGKLQNIFSKKDSIERQEALDLANNLTDSLGYANEALESFNKLGDSDGSMAAHLEILTTLRMAENKLQKCASMFDVLSHSESETMSKTAQTISLSYITLALEFEKLAKTQESLAVATSEEEVYRIASEISKVTADIDSAWKDFAQLVALSTNLLVDMDRVESDGTLKHLLLTKDERTKIIERLDSSFDQDLSEFKAGQHAIVGSAAIFRKVVNGDHLSFDE